MKKQWWKSKTIQSILYFAVRYILNQHGVAVPPEVDALAGAWGLIGVRTAINDNLTFGKPSADNASPTN